MQNMQYSSNSGNTANRNQSPVEKSQPLVSANAKTGRKAHDNDDQLEEKRQKLAWFKSAKERKKTRENVFLANAIKKQIKPAVSSLEEDHITEIINNALVKNVHGIDIARSK